MFLRFGWEGCLIFLVVVLVVALYAYRFGYNRGRRRQ